MALENTFIPYGGYWSSPFCRWQGALAQESSVKLAAQTAERFLKHRQISADSFDTLMLGFTVPQQQSFYGAPWVAGMIGADGVTGPNISQACATSVRTMAVAAMEIEAGQVESAFCLTCDRTSNGPHIYYPNPMGIGGRGDAEDPVWDNFNRDPWAKCAMIDTAENVAKEVGITKEEQDAIALLRYEQYQEAAKNDHAFHRRYMFPIEIRKGKKTSSVELDEGVFPTTKEGLAGLKPAKEGGTVSFGTQTYPADGNAGMFLTTKARAAALSTDQKTTVQVLGFGTARVKKAFMPMAVVPAARAALENANVKLGEMKAIKTHNPFAVNDVYFSRQMDVAPEKMNRFGSPLIFGHPQGPTGMRAVIELIEELVMAGGGYGVFSGCAAGDTAMAMVIKVS